MKRKTRCARLGPSHWTGDSKVSSREQVAPEVLDGVQKLMDATWKDCVTRDRYTCGTGDKEILKFEVVQVLRNQNPNTWAEYVRKRAEIQHEVKDKSLDMQVRPKTAAASQKVHVADKVMAPLQRDVNEMLLFHGTKPSAADTICETHFKTSGNDALFGPGVYFAECSSKSDEYVLDQDGIYQGLYATLLCRVTMGRILYDDNLKPDSNALTTACKKGDFHGVLGDREKVRGTYREFVVYDRAQAYPEYIVLYRRVPAQKKCAKDVKQDKAHDAKDGKHVKAHDAKDGKHDRAHDAKPRGRVEATAHKKPRAKTRDSENNSGEDGKNMKIKDTYGQKAGNMIEATAGFLLTPFLSSQRRKS